MKCFIHANKEAIASCKTCGKAMCADCSSFDGHSGVCPTCKKPELDKESAALKTKIRKTERRMTIALVFAIVTFFLIFPLIMYSKYKRRAQKEIGQAEERIEKIQKSIGFVNAALKKGSGDLDTNPTQQEEEEITDEAWQCQFCRTINKNGKVCKFCAKKKT